MVECIICFDLLHRLRYGIKNKGMGGLASEFCGSCNARLQAGLNADGGG